MKRQCGSDRLDSKALPSLVSFCFFYEFLQVSPPPLIASATGTPSSQQGVSNRRLSDWPHCCLPVSRPLRVAGHSRGTIGLDSMHCTCVERAPSLTALTTARVDGLWVLKIAETLTRRAKRMKRPRIYERSNISLRSLQLDAFGWLRRGQPVCRTSVPKQYDGAQCPENVQGLGRPCCLYLVLPLSLIATDRPDGPCKAGGTSPSHEFLLIFFFCPRLVFLTEPEAQASCCFFFLNSGMILLCLFECKILAGAVFFFFARVDF